MPEHVVCFSCGAPITDEIIRYVGATPLCEQCLSAVVREEPAAGERGAAMDPTRRHQVRARRAPVLGLAGVILAVGGIALLLLPMADAGAALRALGQALILAGAILAGFAWRPR